MANFRPLNDYMMYVFDKMAKKYNFKGPFLDAGCGTGYVALELAKRGWKGKAIDYSDESIRIAKGILNGYKSISVSKQTIEKEKGKYNTIILWDVLEHIKNDQKFLEKISSLLTDQGYFILAGPSNPKEWRWDDDFYGHYRRYTLDNLSKKYKKVSIEIIEAFDITFPFFWLIRRIYTSLKRSPSKNYAKGDQTKKSGFLAAYKMPLLIGFINLTNFMWGAIFWIQFYLFRHQIDKGFAFFVVARKKHSSK